MPDLARSQGPSSDHADELTTRCGEQTVAGLNEALWAKASAAKLPRATGVLADTTVIRRECGVPDRFKLLAKAVG